MIAKAARAAGLKVALHIEPFPGRTPTALKPMLRAFAASGIVDFYIYDSTTTPDADWRTLNQSLSGVRVFANTALPGKALSGRIRRLLHLRRLRVRRIVVSPHLRGGEAARVAVRPVGRAWLQRGARDG